MKLWAGIAIAVALVLGAVYFEHKARHGDRELPVYVTGAQRMLAGEEIYRPGEDDKSFTYPPFFAAVFAPFHWLPEPAQLPLWFAVNFLLLLWILERLHRWTAVARAAASVPAWAFWLLTALLAARHVFAVFENQSHDLLIVGAMVAAAEGWRRARGIAAGAWAGLGAACKATPLLFLEVLVLRRNVRGTLALLVVAAAATLLPDLLLPRADGGSWAMAWYRANLAGIDVGGAAEARGIWNSHSYLNQSLSGTLTRLFSPAEHSATFVDPSAMVWNAGPGLLKAITLFMQLAVVALIGIPVLWGRRAAAAWDAGAEEISRLAEVGLVLCGMVLLSPMSSKSHFAVLLLPVALCVVAWLADRRDRILGLLLLAVLLLGTLTVKGIVGRELGNRLLAWGSVTWTALLMLVATARLRWWGPPAAAFSARSTAA